MCCLNKDKEKEKVYILLGLFIPHFTDKDLSCRYFIVRAQIANYFQTQTSEDIFGPPPALFPCECIGANSFNVFFLSSGVT